MNLPRIYISGPYTQGMLDENLRNAIQAGLAVINAGGAPFVPHLNFMMELNQHVPYRTWLDVDLAWVEASEALWRLPGFSPGADRELERAQQLGIPVFFQVKDVEEFINLHIAAQKQQYLNTQGVCNEPVQEERTIVSPCLSGNSLLRRTHIEYPEQACGLLGS